MFSAFIVDDDKQSVEVTYTLFPWNELNVTRIEKIYTPTGLAQKILLENPDIVFIDIEMGDMSGLQVIKECKEAGSNSYFVIVSGHDNFDYAHTAVNLGAIYYLLKPISKKDVDSVFAKLKGLLDISSKQNNFSDHLASAKNFTEYLTEHLKDKKCRFVISSLENFLYKKMEELLSPCIFSTHSIGKHKHLLIIDSDTFGEAVIAKLNDFSKTNNIVCAVSKVFSKEDSHYDIFQQTNQLSYNQFVNPNGQLLIEPINSDTSTLKDMLDTLFWAIDEKQTDIIKQNLSILPQLFLKQQYTMSHAVWFYNTLIGRINIVLNHNHIFPLSQMDEEDLQNYFSDFTELCVGLYDSILEILKPQQFGDSYNNQLWEKVVMFIEQNYREKLQVKDICKNLFISERTFYYLFKSNVKVTFVEYLTEFRIKKSKILLLTTNLPISAVAEKVGIKDHYYFNKVFKKYTGITPVKFKIEEGVLTNDQELKD